MSITSRPATASGPSRRPSLRRRSLTADNPRRRPAHTNRHPTAYAKSRRRECRPGRSVGFVQRHQQSTMSKLINGNNMLTWDSLPRLRRKSLQRSSTAYSCEESWVYSSLCCLS